MDLDRALLQRAGGAAHGPHLDRALGEAGDIPTLLANEMGMHVERMTLARPDQFETPDMVTEVRAARQLDLREVDEVPIEGCSIKARVREAIADLRM